MARFEDIKLNDIVTIEFNGTNINFKALVVHHSSISNRIEIVGLPDKDISHLHNSNMICLSGSTIAINVKNIEDHYKKKGVKGNIEYVAGIEKHSILCCIYSSEKNIKLINIGTTNNIATHKLNDFLACKKCNDPVYMAGPNQMDGSFVCYSCRSNPIRIYY